MNPAVHLVHFIWSNRLQTAVKFRQTIANSENPDETALNEPSHQDFYCSLSKLLFFIPRVQV